MKTINPIYKSMADNEWIVKLFKIYKNKQNTLSILRGVNNE